MSSAEAVLTRPLETQIINGKWVLGESFISKYRGKQPDWGFDGLGWVVYVRTYAREKANGFLEEMYETAERVTLGNYNLPLVDGKIDPTATKEEVELFYDSFFNLALTPPGRGWWMSGTDYASTCGDALNNCWYVDVKPMPRRNGELPKASTPFVFTFDQAMKGGGVGAGVYKSNIEQFSTTGNAVNLVFVVGKNHGDLRELKEAGFKYITPEKYKNLKHKKKGSHTGYVNVEDSKEGFSDDALANVVDAHFDGRTTLYVDLSKVRPRGAKIKRFGGVASGIVPLIKGLLHINKVLNRSAFEGRRMSTVEAADLIQIIGTVVVSGNVRRTALIIMGDQDDLAFIESKDYSKMGLEPSQWRWASNNSIIIDTKTPRERLVEAAGAIYFNGEPGIVNLELSRNYGRLIDGLQPGIDPEVNGTNPCGEVSLSSGEPCNLFEINLLKCRQMGISWETAAKLAARYTYRVTFMPYEWDMSREKVWKNRRLGVGITAVSDYVLTYYDGDFRDKGFLADLNELYLHVNATNHKHAFDLGTEVSIKKTTIKPSGSQSKVMGVSAGQHDHWSPYFIQRMRIAANAPVMQLVYNAGYPVEPVITGRQNDGSPVYDYNTVVVEFPVKAPTADHPKFRSSKDVSLLDQAERQAILQTYWSDNAVSATLTFHKASEENGKTDQDVVDEITEVLTKYQEVFKSTSLLPHAVGTYDQMPWEEITKEEYERRVSLLNGRPWDYMGEGIRGVLDDIEQDCIGGACPTR